MKLCIFSGTFNPVHNAHVEMAHAVVEKLGIEKMIIIPNNIPPHKNEQNIVDATHRLRMLKLAFNANNEIFDISDIEIKLGGKSYSLNTIQKIKEMYKIEQRINFIVGEDSFLAIKNWHKYDELVPLVKFIVIPRSKNSDIKKIAQNLKIKELEYEALQLPFMPISSSEIRNHIKRDYNLEKLIPPSVANYVKEQGLYRKFSYDEMKVLLEQVFNADMKHCIGVADKAVELAQTFGEDEQKAKIAGILHDCVKYIGIEKIQNIMKENNIKVLAQEETAPKTLHAPVGAFVAKNYFNIQDQEILDAIRYHTVARIEMSTLEKIIFIADKIEPITREKEFIDKVEPHLKKGLDSAISKYLELLATKLESEGHQVSSYTKEVINHFNK